MTTESTTKSIQPESIKDALQNLMPNAQIDYSQDYPNATAFEIHMPAGTPMPRALKSALNALRDSGDIGQHHMPLNDITDITQQGRHYHPGVTSIGDDTYITILNSKLGILAEAIEHSGQGKVRASRSFEPQSHHGHAARKFNLGAGGVGNG